MLGTSMGDFALLSGTPELNMASIAFSLGNLAALVSSHVKWVCK